MVHVRQSIERPTPKLLRCFAGILTATIHEAMDRRGAVAGSIKPMARGMKLCGPAVTVQFPGGDNLMIHKAGAVAERGDVIVAAQGDKAEPAVWGEILCAAAQARGIQGFVTDAYVRDSQRIAEMGFPVFAKGVTIKGAASAKVAVARKLAIRLYILLRDRIDYEEFCRRGSHAGRLGDVALA